LSFFFFLGDGRSFNCSQSLDSGSSSRFGFFTTATHSYIGLFRNDKRFRVIELDATLERRDIINELRADAKTSGHDVVAFDIDLDNWIGKTFVVFDVFCLVFFSSVSLQTIFIKQRFSESTCIQIYVD
jgi:hypothetical protein